MLFSNALYLPDFKITLFVELLFIIVKKFKSMYYSHFMSVVLEIYGTVKSG